MSVQSLVWWCSPLIPGCRVVGYIVHLLFWPIHSVEFLLIKTNRTVLLIILFCHCHVIFFFLLSFKT